MFLTQAAFANKENHYAAPPLKKSVAKELPGLFDQLEKFIKQAKNYSHLEEGFALVDRIRDLNEIVKSKETEGKVDALHNTLFYLLFPSIKVEFEDEFVKI